MSIFRNLKKFEKIQITLYRILEKGGPNSARSSRLCDLFLSVLIFLNLIAISLESVESLNHEYSKQFLYFELFSVSIFFMEYCLRVWCARVRDDMEGASTTKKRLRYVLSPHGLIDLLAFVPSIAAIFMTTTDMRWIRVVRMIRLFKISNYSTALEDLVSAIKDQRAIFAASLYLFAITFFVSSTLMYLVESDSQPDAFGSIPSAMWWSVVTLTTVGYGDVSPVTILGKIIGAGTAVMGVITVALLTGVTASAFANQVQRRKEIFQAEVTHALEDGEISAKEEEHLETLRSRYGIEEEHARAIFDIAHDYLNKR